MGTLDLTAWRHRIQVSLNPVKTGMQWRLIVFGRTTSPTIIAESLKSFN